MDDTPTNVRRVCPLGARALVVSNRLATQHRLQRAAVAPLQGFHHVSAALSFERSARLRPLTKLVGTWELRHQDLNTGEQWDGKDTFEWLPGGHFMAFLHETEQGVKDVMIPGCEMGWEETEPGREIIGHCLRVVSVTTTACLEVDDRTVQFWLNNKQ